MEIRILKPMTIRLKIHDHKTSDLYLHNPSATDILFEAKRILSTFILDLSVNVIHLNLIFWLDNVGLHWFNVVCNGSSWILVKLTINHVA